MATAIRVVDRFQDLGDVNTSSLSSNDFVVYNSGSGKFVNASVANSLNYILPSQTGNSGKFLKTDGSSTSWATSVVVAAGSSGQLQYNEAGILGGAGYFSYNPVNGQLISTTPSGTAPFSIISPTVVSSFNADLLDGYHSSAFQSVDSTLTALAAYNTNGILVQTSADTFTGRSLGVTDGLSISNANGSAGNPTVGVTSINGSKIVGDIAGYASGSVKGPVSSTDNAIVRWDGTTGKLVQNSALIAGDYDHDTDGSLLYGNYFEFTKATLANWAGAGIGVYSAFSLYRDDTSLGKVSYFYINYSDGIVPWTQIASDIRLTGNLQVNGILTVLGGTSKFLSIVPDTLTSNRTLSLVTNDASRTLTLQGNPTLDNWFDQSVKTAATPTFGSLKLSDTNASNTINLVVSNDITSNQTLNVNLNTTGAITRNITVSGDTTIKGTNTGDEIVNATFIIDNSPVAIPGSTVSFPYIVPFNCTITGWDLTVGSTTAIVTIDVQSGTPANGTDLPTYASLVGTGTKPAVSSHQRAASASVSDWSGGTTASAGDYVQIVVQSSPTPTATKLIFRLGIKPS